MSKYRVIPVLVLPPQKTSVDFKKYMGIVWVEKRSILKTTGLFLLLGVLYFLLSGREYTSEIVLLPEYQNDKTQQSGLFSQLGLAGGFGSGGTLTTYNGNSNAIRIDLYPSIVKSVPMMKKVIDHSYHIVDEGVTVNLTDYFEKVYRPSVFGYVYMYIVWVPELVIESVKWMFGIEPPDAQSKWIGEGEVGSEYVYLTKDEQKLLRAMQERVQAQVNMDDYTFSVSVTMPDAPLAAQIANVVVDSLTEYVKTYRTEKLAHDLQFIEDRLAGAELRVNEARMDLAVFKDRNKNVVSEVYLTEVSNLENEYQLAYSLYSTLTQEREAKRIQLQEATPIFKVLESANVPTEPSSPNPLMLISFFAAIGLTVAIIRLILQSNSFEFYLRRNK